MASTLSDSPSALIERQSEKESKDTVRAEERSEQESKDTDQTEGEPEKQIVGITMTDVAAAHIKKQLARRGKGQGIRLGVKTSGCSGMAYVLEFADEELDGDSVFDHDNGVKIFIDPKSLVYMDGTELDFVKEGLNEGFQFSNPNVASECGCGESFNV